MNMQWKWSTHIIRCLALALTITMLSACAAGTGGNTPPAQEELPQAAPHEQEQPDAETEPDMPGSQQPAETEPPAQEEETPEELGPVAELPEHGIALYALEALAESDEGVMLEIGEQRQRMDWRYKTPRQVMPVLHVHDYDGDGQEELAAILNIGSGTGVAVDELHIVEFHDVNNSSDEPFTDFKMQEEDYMTQLREAIAFEKVERGGEWFGMITVDGRTRDIGLTDFLASYEVEAGAIEDALGFGNIILFEAAGDRLTFRAAVGLIVGNLVEPQYIGSVNAVVAYKEGSFTLEAFDFTEEI